MSPTRPQRDNLNVRHAVSWPFVGPPVALLVVFGEIGARLAPPAARGLDLVLRRRGSPSRPEALVLDRRFARLVRPPRTVGGVCDAAAIAMGWSASLQWLHERQFDYLVAAQNANLRLTTAQLSAAILNFVAERGRHAPPPPRPTTWNEDEAAFARYETETVGAFERQFGKQTRVAHDVFGRLGIRDRDFEVFYAHPANVFQMQVVAVKLAALVKRVPE